MLLRASYSYFKQLTWRHSRRFTMKRAKPMLGHLKLCHLILAETISKGDIVIDATCGNGHDTLFLAKCALDVDSGCLYGFDVQDQSLKETRSRLQSEISKAILSRIHLDIRSHESFPDTILPGSVAAITYNLGYLPGGDKTITTTVKSTVSSLEAAFDLVAQGGLISIMCYRGHTEGKYEEAAVLQLLLKLDSSTWRVMTHNSLNASDSAPILYTVYRLK